MHRSVRETPLVAGPGPPSSGLDIFDLAGRLVASCEKWDCIIDMLGTLPHGEYHVSHSGRRLALASIDRARGPTLKLYPR